MSQYTEKQKAYHLRKMRTRVARLDVNKDGFISREDYELIAKRLPNITESQRKQVQEGFKKIAETFKLKKDAKYPVEEFAKIMSETVLSKTPEEHKEMVRVSHSVLFDIIDTNHNGSISPKEFATYLKVVAPDVTEAEAKHAFDVIDANKNGKITREEFFAAADDFLRGVEETETSKVFLGKLLD